MNKLAILIMVFFIFTALSAEEWQVVESSENSVKFISSTTLLDFDGTTSAIDGYVYWEGDKIFAKNNQLYFEVQLNTVKTGIDKRDRDMREEVLETDKWPITYFKGEIINYEQLGTKEKYKVTTKGVMFIHGIEKEMQIDGIIEIKNGVMNIQTNYSVFLEDYNIEAPSLLAFIKVADEIKLELDFNLEQKQDIN